MVPSTPREPPHMIVRVFFAVLFVIGIAVPASAEPALWKVQGPHATVYLFGTVHILKSTTQWRTPKIEQAFASAGSLWEEVPNGDDVVAMQPLVMQLGLDPAHPLSSLLSDDGKAKLAAFTRADNARVARQTGEKDKAGPMGGWDQMRSRLVGTAQRLEDGAIKWSTGRPMLYVFANCKDFIRTVPVLQHDQNRAEDLDTDAEDHAADDGRYACLSRPWIKSLPKDDAVKRDAYGEHHDERYSDSTATL